TSSIFYRADLHKGITLLCRLTGLIIPKIEMGGITENSMYFYLKYICVIKPYMGSVLLLQINYCRDMIINIYCIERSGV
ncbi:MAG: hypothetical protein ACLSF3_19085, partial [Anaerobutyricum hallii]|uniref:hypothetical protein n=1 Tax=Anaerobutyricum hallii TaxID=39488 RepID=UPI00399194F5